MSTVSPNYILASSAGYKLNIGNEGRIPYDESTYAHKEEFKDMVMSRPGLKTDLYNLHTRALITVNGFVYPTSFTDEKLYVKNATTTMLRTRDNSVGVYSFFNLEKDLKKIHLTEDMLSRDGEYTYHEKIIITLPEEVDGVLFIFAGYIILENDRYLKRVGDKSFAFYPSRINYIDKMYELARYRDIFNELELEVSNHNDSVVMYNELTSDESIVKMLLTFNTFMVNLPKTKISHEIIPLEHTSVPNNYRIERVPKLIPSHLLMGGHGKVIEFKFKAYNEYKYTILTLDSYYNNLVDAYTPKYALTLLSRHRKIGDTYRLSPAFFLKLILENVE